MTHDSIIVFEQVLKNLQSGKDLTGKDGVFMPLIDNSGILGVTKNGQCQSIIGH